MSKVVIDGQEVDIQDLSIETEYEVALYYPSNLEVHHSKESWDTSPLGSDTEGLLEIIKALDKRIEKLEGKL